MTFLTMIVILIIGILMLLIGFSVKNRWLKLLSIIPLAVSLSQLAVLFLWQSS
nr:hypothetical protein [Lysinibacillus timonensis]